MSRFRRQPVALTIAGSDSGGGAGLQADLKVLTALGVHGTTAITCVTAQNPRGVAAVQAVTPALLKAQLQSLFEELRPAAAKTGMLHSAALIRVVAGFWSIPGRPPLVVDPVMVATSGARLLEPGAIRVLVGELLPRAVLVTPNVDEAEILCGRRLRSMEALRQAAREIHATHGCAALVKGGHLRTGRRAMDVYVDAEGEWLLDAERVPGVKTHGTGCTYSAAVTAGLAAGLPLRAAVFAAKDHVSAAIASSVRIGRHMALGSVSCRRIS